MNLKDKVAIVTGGSQGIGKAIALRFAGEGARVVIASRTREKGLAVRDMIMATGGKSEFIQTDISRKPDIQNLIQETKRHFGPLDILVNNAGLLKRGSFMDTSEADWDQVMNTNLKGTFLLSQAAAGSMIKRGGGGRIINITSIDGQVVYYHGHHAAYGVSKAGLIMLTKGLAVELAPHGINVNAIAPGVVKTEISAGSMNNTQHLKNVTADIPLGRLAEADEIGGAAVFLASDDSTYVTGTTIFVDGGWVIH